MSTSAAHGWSRWKPYAWAAALGALLSSYPHLQARVATGSYTWVADHDELGLYLPIVSQARWNHPARLGDPLFADERPSQYPRIQFVPFSSLAAFLGLSSVRISFLWRLFAGVSMACGWLFVFRRLAPGFPLSLPFALLLLSDSGLLEGKILLRQPWLFLQAVAGNPALFDSVPQLHPELRIITPGLSLVFLLFFFGCFGAYLRTGGKRASSAATISLGLLFYAYFFFWTTAYAGLALAVLLDRERWKRYFTVMAGGALLGVPAVLETLKAKTQGSPDWLPRTDHFLPIPHTAELIIPKVALLLLAVLAFRVFRGRPVLLFLWAQAAAGVALENHQLVTGLQLENFHFAYHWGPALSLLLLLAVADVLGEKPLLHSARFRWGVALFVAVHLSLAFVMRHLEATRTVHTVELSALLRSMEDARLPPLRPDAVVAGDRSRVEMLATLHNVRPLAGYLASLSPSLSNAEWNRREALNGLASGLSEEAFLRAQEAEVAAMVWGPWGRSDSARKELVAERLRLFREMALKPEASLGSFGVRYVVLAGGAATPRGAKLVAKGDDFTLFETTP